MGTLFEARGALFGTRRRPEAPGGSRRRRLEAPVGSTDLQKLIPVARWGKTSFAGLSVPVFRGPTQRFLLELPYETESCPFLKKLLLASLLVPFFDILLSFWMPF